MEQGIVLAFQGKLNRSSVSFTERQMRMYDKARLMSVHETLKSAIRNRRCVLMMAEQRRREVCPHALGYKDKRLKVLAYQYAGGSASGLANDGGWRCFVLDDVWWAEIIDGTWHSSRDYIVKAETSFDYVECQVLPMVSSSCHEG